jgi:hypothetical protein
VTGRQWTLVAGYAALTFLFGGVAGLVVGGLVVAGAMLLRLPRRLFWIASVVCMAIAPIALIVQGLPGTPIAGPGFGTRHMAAHVLVALSMATAGWAGLSELADAPR